MTRQIPYINEEVANRDFKYYIFDWDDNILHMPTRIKMEHRDSVDDPWRPVEVSTATFALVRGDEEHYRAPGGVWADAFRNFEDAPGRDNFSLGATTSSRTRLPRLRRSSTAKSRRRASTRSRRR